MDREELSLDVGHHALVRQTGFNSAWNICVLRHLEGKLFDLLRRQQVQLDASEHAIRRLVTQRCQNLLRVHAEARPRSQPDGTKETAVDVVARITEKKRQTAQKKRHRERVMTVSGPFYFEDLG